MDSYEQSEQVKECEEEELYDSDSEEGTSALGLRRRACSDDEEDGHRRKSSYYDEDLVANQGAPPREEEEEEEDEEDAADEEEEEEEEEEEYGDYDNEEIGEIVATSKHEEQSKLHREDTVGLEGKESNKGQSEEEKKDAEPFVVPTAGAFYMHDDRFHSDGVTRPRSYNGRRNGGGRKLWEAKDEKPWLHDRFEELKLREEKNYGQGARGRRGRGRQGRGQGRGRDSVYTRGRENKEQMTEDTTPRFTSRNEHGRGRGLRRAKMDDYEFKESRLAGNRAIPSSSRENSTTVTSSKPPAMQTISKPQESASKKPTTSSILNSASPPFFPTGAISHNLNGVLAGTSKVGDDKVFEKDVTPVNRVVSTSKTGVEKVMTGGPLRPSSNPENLMNLGLSSTDAQVQAHAAVNRNAEQTLTSMQQQVIKTGSRSMVQQHRQVRPEVKNTKHLIEQTQLSSVSQQPNRETAPAESLHMQHALQQLQKISQVQLSQNQVQPVQSQQPATLSTISVGDIKTSSASVINKIGAARGTHTTTVQPASSTFVYGGSSMTNGLRNGVQFPGQPQPVVGVQMPLPGYSSQTQFGFQNSEVTWIPILAGGSMGSNYGSPYIAVDGSPAGVYYASQASQASQSSSFPIPGELAGSKAGNSVSFKAPVRTEPEDLGQQRKRYSQMTFSEERR